MKAHKEHDPAGTSYYLKPGDHMTVVGKGECEIMPDGDLKSTFNSKDHDGQISACSIDFRNSLMMVFGTALGHHSPKYQMTVKPSQVYKSQDVKELGVRQEKEGIDEDA